LLVPTIVEPAQDLFQAVADGDVGGMGHDDHLSICEATERRQEAGSLPGFTRANADRL
jgi:hypothetical protein